MKYIIPIFVLMFLIVPLIVRAQVPFTNYCTNIPSANTYSQNLCTLIYNISTFIFWGGLAFAVIMIIVGGIQYITAGSDEEKVKGARKTIINGLIGAAILFAVGFLIGMISSTISGLSSPGV